MQSDFSELRSRYHINRSVSKGILAHASVSVTNKNVSIELLFSALIQLAVSNPFFPFDYSLCPLCLCGQLMNSGTTNFGSTPALWPSAKNCVTAWRPRGPSQASNRSRTCRRNWSACSSFKLGHIAVHIVRRSRDARAQIRYLLSVVDALRGPFHSKSLRTRSHPRQRQTGAILPPFAEVDNQ